MAKRTRTFLIILYAAALTHLPSLSGEFVWDDQQMIVTNSDLRDLGDIPGYFDSNYFGSRADVELYRPLVNTSLAVDFALWGRWGATEGDVGPTGFRVTNLLLHLAAGALLYSLLRRLTVTPWLPEVAAAIFLVHPASAEPVGWIVARGDLLAMVFLLATVHLHLSGRKRAVLHAGALVCFLAGLFGKLAAAPAPLLILLLEVYFRGLRLRELPRPRHLLRYASYLLPVLIYGVVRSGAMETLVPASTGRIWGGAEFMPATVVAGALLFRYAAVFLLPVGLCADYSADPVYESGNLPAIASHPAVVLFALAVPALIILAWLLRKRSPWASFGILWFFAALIPVSQIIRIGTAMADRFLYVPAAGACAALAALLLALPRRRWVGIGVVVAALATLTVLREGAWRSDLAMADDVLRPVNYPEDADAWNLRGLHLGRQGDRKEARECYERGASADPANRYVLKNLGAVLYEDGDLAGARKVLTRGLMLPQAWDRQRASIAYNLSVVATAEGELATRRHRDSDAPPDGAPLNTVESGLGKIVAARMIRFVRTVEAATILEKWAIPCRPRLVLAYRRLGKLLGGRLGLFEAARRWNSRAGTAASPGRRER